METIPLLAAPLTVAEYAFCPVSFWASLQSSQQLLLPPHLSCVHRSLPALLAGLLHLSERCAHCCQHPPAMQPLLHVTAPCDSEPHTQICPAYAWLHSFGCGHCYRKCAIPARAGTCLIQSGSQRSLRCACMLLQCSDSLLHPQVAASAGSRRCILWRDLCRLP